MKQAIPLPTLAVAFSLSVIQTCTSATQLLVSKGTTVDTLLGQRQRLVLSTIISSTTLAALVLGVGLGNRRSLVYSSDRVPDIDSSALFTHFLYPSLYRRGVLGSTTTRDLKSETLGSLVALGMPSTAQVPAQADNLSRWTCYPIGCEVHPGICVSHPLLQHM
jgi:hypothetical protein